MATSPDGVSWTTLANGANGIVVPSKTNVWDLSFEMPEFIKVENTYKLFYSGYDPKIAESSGGTIWGDLGLATSVDGVNFVRTASGPVMKRTANWYDKDGITDPTIVESNGTLYMVYIGWCMTNCTFNNGSPAFYVLKATSKDGGLTWTKEGLLDPKSAQEGVSEAFRMIGLQHPDLVKEADGNYAIYYGVDNGCAGNKIGLFKATGPAPFGPFTVVPTPIFCLGTQSFETSGTDGAFPSVLNDNGRGRIYYTGVEESTYTYKVGLVQTPEIVATPPVPTPTPTPTPIDTVPPKISIIAAGTITQNSAKIVWKTNEAADTNVFYGTSKSKLDLVSNNVSPILSHVVTLTNLKANTKYYYTVTSKDSAGNLSRSTIKSFITKRATNSLSRKVSGNGSANNTATTVSSVVPNIANVLAQFNATTDAKNSLVLTVPLRLGSQGEAVIRLQEFLGTYTTTYPDKLVSGYYGPMTEAAVKRFQVENKIVSTGTPETTGFGTVGPKTLEVINTILTSKQK